MSLNLPICLIVVLVIIEVRSQVCTRNVKTSRQQTYSYMTNEKPCDKCDNRRQVQKKTKMVPVTVNVPECCPEYRKLDEKLEASSTNCVKLDQTHVRGCSETCQNGNCSPANECICFGSYEQYPPGSNTCVPECDPRYERVEGVCKPHCSKPCRGGYCTAPEDCNCYPGWDMNDQGECIPNCNPGCGNGICVDLNKCSCLKGYELRENASPQCVTTAITSESTTTNIKEHDDSPIPTESTPSSTDTKDYKDSLEISPAERHHEKSIEPVRKESPTLLYIAVGANIVLLIIIIAIILYKNPGIYKRFQASNCTKKTSEDGEVLHYYDYVQLPLPIRSCEENVYAN